MSAWHAPQVLMDNREGVRECRTGSLRSTTMPDSIIQTPHGRSNLGEGSDQQHQQCAADFPTRPEGSIEHPVIVVEVPIVAQT